MRIAVITPHTLLNLGLKHLFQRYFDISPALYNRVDDFFDDTPEQFDAYLLFADTLMAYSDFFLPRKSRIMLLTASHENPTAPFAPVLPVHEDEEALIERLESFVEQLDRQAENLSHDLSPREIEVLKLVAKGFMNKEIADQLNISINTVLSHRKNLTSKLGIKTVSGLSFYALMNGYISDIDNK
ncbi:MAG TPA: response regulator transcription factor [Candidatus Barnesiella merdipullorum]|nr:response regulator transcription factor [Candidatus Barnesiella merdipullorum]